MRFNNRKSIKTSLYFLKKKEFRNVLMKNLGLNDTNVEDIFDIKKNIFNIPHHRIIKNCLIYEVCRKSIIFINVNFNV